MIEVCQWVAMIGIQRKKKYFLEETLEEYSDRLDHSW